VGGTPRAIAKGVGSLAMALATHTPFVPQGVPLKSKFSDLIGPKTRGNSIAAVRDMLHSVRMRRC